MNWAATEFESIDLGDPRRNRRAIRLIEHLGAKPGASIPQACGDWADTLAAYRFFGNQDVQWLLRSKLNRTLSEGGKLWSRVTQGESLGEIRFTLASRQGQRAREVIREPVFARVRLSVKF
ncbi:MAG: hypothetical protein RLZ81_439 [Pseudomonadota bacterium]|jgi:hypothetical protein